MGITDGVADSIDPDHWLINNKYVLSYLDLLLFSKLVSRVKIMRNINIGVVPW